MQCESKSIHNDWHLNCRTIDCICKNNTYAIFWPLWSQLVRPLPCSCCPWRQALSVRTSGCHHSTPFPVPLAFHLYHSTHTHPLITSTTTSRSFNVRSSLSSFHPHSLLHPRHQKHGCQHLHPNVHFIFHSYSLPYRHHNHRLALRVFLHIPTRPTHTHIATPPLLGPTSPFPLRSPLLLSTADTFHIHYSHYSHSRLLSLRQYSPSSEREIYIQGENEGKIFLPAWYK